MSILFISRRIFSLFTLLVLFSLTLHAATPVVQYLGYTRTVTSIGQKGPYTSVAVDRDGNTLVYDSNQGSPIVYTVAPDGNVHIYLSASDGMMLGAIPSQISIDRSGTVYIPDPSNNRVFVSTSSRTFTMLPLNAGQTLSQPTSVLVVPSGDMYILQRSLGLAKYSNGNVTQLSLNDPDGTAGAIYSGMAYAHLGDLNNNLPGSIIYLNTGAASEVLRYDLGANYASQIIDKGAAYPALDNLRPNVPVGFTADTSAITSDDKGNVYFASQAGQQLYIVNNGVDSIVLVYGGPYIRADALAWTPWGTFSYIDPNKVLSEMGRHVVNFGPVSGATANLYYDYGKGYYDRSPADPYPDPFQFTLYGCTSQTADQLGCVHTVKSNPAVAGVHYSPQETDPYNTVDAPEVVFRQFGVQSELASLGTQPIVYGTAANPIPYQFTNGPAYDIPSPTGGIAVEPYGYVSIGSYSTYIDDSLLSFRTLGQGYYFDEGHRQDSTHHGMLLAFDTGIQTYLVANDGAIYHTQTAFQSDTLVASAESPMPTGIGVDSAGTFYWASPQDHAIKHRNTELINTLVPLIYYTEPGLMPVGIVIEANNTILTFDSSSQKFLRIYPNGSVKRTAALNVNLMGGFVALPDGTIVYVNLANNQLHSYSPTGVDTMLGSSNSPQLALRPDGGIIGVDTVAKTLVVYPIANPTVAFNGSYIGKTSSDSPKSILFTNVGVAATGTTAIDFEGGTGFFLGGNSCGMSVDTSKTCVLSVNFTPGIGGANTGSMTYTAAGQMPTTVVTLTGNGLLADHLGLIGPNPISTNQVAGFNVTAYTPDGTTATSYRGTVHFTSSDPSTPLPADATFDGSTGIVNTLIMFHTAGPQTITATDVANPAFTTTFSFVVTAGPPNQVVGVSGGQQTVPVGQNFAPFSVAIADYYGHRVPGVLVTFTPSGGCVFKSGNTATTGTDGVVVSPICTAAGTTGNFTVSINTPGLPTPFVYTETTTGFSGFPSSGPVAFLGAQHTNPADTFVSPAGLAVNNKGLTYVYDANVTGPSPIIYSVTQDGVKTPYLTAADGLNMSSIAGAQLSLDATGKLYIPDPGGNRIYVSSAAHTVTTMNITGLASPMSIIVPASGTTYVLENNGLYTLSGSTLTKVNFTDPDGNTNPSYIGMALNRQGKMFLLNDTFGELLAYDTTTHATLKIYDNTTSIGGLMPTTLNGYDMITVDYEGYAYSGDFANGRIIKTMPDGSAYQVYTGIKSIAVGALSVNPSGSIAYTDYVAHTLGNVSDSFADLGSATSLSAAKAVLYFNSSVQLNFDAGTFGSNFDTYLDIVSPNSCFGGTVNPGYCQAGVGLTSAPAGSYAGYESVIPTAGGAAVTVPLFAANVGSALVDLDAPVKRFGAPNSGYALKADGAFFGSTGPIAVDGSGTIYTNAHHYTLINSGLTGGLMKIPGIHDTDHYGNLSAPLQGVMPTLLAIDGKGTLYYSDSTNAIYSTDIKTFAAPTMITSASSAVTGLAVDAQGLLLYAAAGKVVRYDPSFASNPSMTIYSAAGAKPQGLTVDANNTAYFFDANIKKFVMVFSDGTVNLSPVVPTDNVSNLLVLPNGTVIYLDKDSNTLRTFTTAGVDHLIGGEISSQLAFLPNGDVAAINTVDQTLDVFPFADPTITFRPTTVGATSTDSPHTDTLTNIGLVATSGESTTNATTTAFATVSTTCNTAVAPGSTCDYVTSYTPTAFGSLTNSNNLGLSFSSQAYPLVLHLQGDGIGGRDINAIFDGFPVAGVVQTADVLINSTTGGAYFGYRGTLHYTTDDPTAVIPPDHTFTEADHGEYHPQFTWKTAGRHAFTITETALEYPGATLLTETFYVTVSPGPAAAISIISGNNQTEPIGQPYSAFTVKTTDAYGNPTSGTTVNYVFGSGCIFAGGSNYLAVTDANGMSTSPVCNASSTPGMFQVSAAIPAVTLVSFNITNTKVTPALIVNVPGVASGVASTATVTEVVDPSSLPGATGTAYYAFDATPTTGSASVSVVNGSESIPVPSNLTTGTHILRVLYGGTRVTCRPRAARASR